MAKTNVARIGVFNVDALGNVIDKNSVPINSLRYSRLENLVIPDENIPNSAGYPTIKEFIEAESDDGRGLVHIDQSFIITSDLLGGSGAGNNSDAFGRLRISNPFTLFDSQNRYAANNKWSVSTASGGSTAFDANSSVMNLNVGLLSGSQVIRETKRVMVYQPGKSLLVHCTFTMNAPRTYLRQRVGYFGADNGAYFELINSTANFVLRSSSSGVLSESRVPQHLWNIDTLDGTGPSGINLSDFSKSMILYMDIEWLGVGDVRMGFVINGKYVNCHTFKHDPMENGIIGTYMTTACLPVRYEITNVSVASSTSSLKQICSNVISEGGYELISQSFNVDLGTTEKELVTRDIVYPVISIKLAAGRLDSVIIPSSINLIVTSNQFVKWSLILNATLTSPTWTTHSSGNVDYDTLASDITGGSVVTSGYIEKGGLTAISSEVDFRYQLGRSLAGVSDTLTLAVSALSNNTKILADLSWYDILT